MRLLRTNVVHRSFVVRGICGELFAGPQITHREIATDKDSRIFHVSALSPDDTEYRVRSRMHVQ